MSKTTSKPGRQVQHFLRPADPAKQELIAVKRRQLERKQYQKAAKDITSADLYQMGMDILENQARIENTLNAILRAVSR